MDSFQNVKKHTPVKLDALDVTSFPETQGVIWREPQIHSDFYRRYFVSSVSHFEDTPIQKSHTGLGVTTSMYQSTGFNW